MYQITSSAIANIPPPAAVVKAVNVSGSDTYDLNTETKEGMLKLFNKDVDGTDLKPVQVTLGRRNYCIASGSGNGGMVFKIMVENVIKGNESVEYRIDVPALV